MRGNPYDGEVPMESAADYVQAQLGRLFDDPLAQGRAARDEAMQRVSDNTEREWKDRAEDAVRTVARARRTFTSDDLWAVIERPREPRALGPVMMAAARNGLIHATNDYQPCRSASRHVAPVRVWRSLIWREGA